MRTFLTFSLAIGCIISVCAQDNNKAFIKAQYEQWSLLDKDTEKAHTKTDKFILQIGKNASYYYDPQTYYVDSMRNDPNGRIILDQATSDALRESLESKSNSYLKILEEKGLLGQSRYRAIKNFKENKITVYDWISPDFYEYSVDMDDLNWQTADSTMTVLGYECILATADYHGRKWKAWFAPEIAVQDGPWQLCGLPGLIMKADTEDGLFGFSITGIQECDEEFKKTHINKDKLFKSNRMAYLKMKDHTRRNRGAYISALTGGKVNPRGADYKGKDDFIETDYHK